MEEVQEKKKQELIIVTGPTAVGKTGIAHTAIHDRSEKLVKFITTTDRDLREGEQHGVDYYKVFPYQFQEKIRANHFFEYEQVFNRGWYGCERFELKRIAELDKRGVIIVDVNGALKLLGMIKSETIDLDAIDPKVVYIHAPKEQLVARLYDDVAQGKRKNDPVDLEKRIARMDYELEQVKQFTNVIDNSNGKFPFALNQFINFAIG